MTSEPPPDEASASPAAEPPSPPPAPPRPEPDARKVAAAVRGCPGVLDLAAGHPVEVATYLPGERILGIRVGPGWAEVHVVATYGTDLTDTATRVRQAVQQASPDPTGPVSVDIVFEDVATPATQTAPATERSTT